jgi:hypothetical protein
MPALSAASPRIRRLLAMGVVPLRRRRGRMREGELSVRVSQAAGRAGVPASILPGIRRLALLPDPHELGDPLIGAMYSALSDAVAKAGLQSVRVVDVTADPAAAVLVFGGMVVPDGIPPERVLRTAALAELHADRARKRTLWETLLALGRGAGGD